MSLKSQINLSSSEQKYLANILDEEIFKLSGINAIEKNNSKIKKALETAQEIMGKISTPQYGTA